MSKGEMISSKEAQIRTFIGYFLLASFASFNYMRPLPDDQQTALGSTLASGGVMLYQMGRDSQ